MTKKKRAVPLGKLKDFSNFSQNQKGFGCVVAAVLLIFSPKELI